MIPARGPQTSRYIIFNVHNTDVSLKEEIATAGSAAVKHTAAIHVDVAVHVADVDVEDVDVDVLFADDHYVCSSVAGSLCSTPKARYPQNCGVTAPL